MKEVVTEKVVGQPYKYTSTARKHTWSADAPGPKGGDSAPNPVEHLLGALGQCIAMTIEGGAANRGWKVPNIRVTIQLDEVDDPAGGTRKIYHFTKNIELHGDLDDTQVKKLEAIGEACTVFKMLEGKKVFKTNVVVVKPAPAKTAPVAESTDQGGSAGESGSGSKALPDAGGATSAPADQGTVGKATDTARADQGTVGKATDTAPGQNNVKSDSGNVAPVAFDVATPEVPSAPAGDAGSASHAASITAGTTEPDPVSPPASCGA